MSLNCCHQQAYCSSSKWYMGMEPRWSDIDRRKPKNSEENLSQCYFVYLISHMDGPEREPWSLRWCKCTFTFLSLISSAH
jgi:hypothetical protein